MVAIRETLATARREFSQVVDQTLGFLEGLGPIEWALVVCVLAMMAMSGLRWRRADDGAPGGLGRQTALAVIILAVFSLGVGFSLGPILELVTTVFT